MVKSFCFIMILFASKNSIANDIFRREGQLKFTTTISPTWYSTKGNAVFLSSHLEYFTNEKFSFKGENHTLVSSSYKTPIKSKFQSYLTFGGLYHFTKSKMDIYVGLHQGVLFTKNEYSTLNKPSIFPNFSINIGSTFFLTEYFHFFIDIKNIYTPIYQMENNINVHAFFVSTGLSFGLNLKRK